MKENRRRPVKDESADDAALIRSFLAGERGAFDELVIRHQDRVFNLCYRFLGDADEADDMAQEIFMKAYRSIDRFRFESKFSTWLYTTAARLAISHYRSNKPRRMPIEHMPFSANPQDIVIRKEASQNLWIQARMLSPGQYKVLWLRYAEDMSVKDIANVMKKTQVQVRVYLHRARLNLAKRFHRSMNSEKMIRMISEKHKLSFL